MAQVIAWATRILPELPPDAVVRLVDGPEARGLEVVSPGAPPGVASRLAERPPGWCPEERGFALAAGGSLCGRVLVWL